MIDSLTVLFNQVLIAIGEVRISDWKSEETRAVVIREIYEVTRDELLAEYPFSCAIKRISLAQLDSENLTEFKYKYILPDDYLYFQSMIDVSSGSYLEIDDIYSIEGRNFYCNYSPVGIKYTKIITEVHEYESSLIQALIYKLAYKVSMSIIQSPEVEIKLYQQYQNALKKAKSVDGFQRKNKSAKSQRWVDVI